MELQTRPDKTSQNGTLPASLTASVGTLGTATSKLTPKQRLFVAEYVVDENGTRAAIAAGYSSKGAHVQACRMLRYANVKQAVAEERQTLVERSKISQDTIVAELRKIAFGTLGEHENGDAIDLANLPKDIKLSDKLKALDQLARLLGLGEPEKHAHLVAHGEMDNHELARRMLGILHRSADSS